MNLAEHILNPGLATPDKLAMSVVGLSRADRWSNARLRQAVLQTANGFQMMGLKAGAQVLLHLPPGPAAPIVLLGAIAAGLVPAIDLRATERVGGPMADIAPSLIVAEKLAVACGQDVPQASPQQLLDAGEPAGFDFIQRDPDQPAYLATNGVGCSHRVALAALQFLVKAHDLCAQDRFLQVGGWDELSQLEIGLLAPLLAGGSVLIPSAGVEPYQIPLLGSRHGGTILCGRASALQGLIGPHWRSWNGLRLGLATSRPDGEELQNSWQQHTGTDLRGPSERDNEPAVLPD
ncbi:hypothetical protein RGQ15_08830 [Paracoccus sp. MBLB3053]|uniref:AMP-dependent synthetase/ligase domain-containing protein n=1 Tax=Paracoccus aurantius TaxID=3073814 RepID=A0ABU2HTP9_9RHOB|nr:AMP-binding protein [Paracoccus sp. MBLB3053]MDS9467674.1 hypothetical protein [Paracoccus sp. MBLB3053]